MGRGLTFHPRYAVAVVDGEGACLLSERSEIVLESPLYSAIASAIDGVRDADGLVDALPDFAPATVYHALLALEERGYLIAADAPEPPEIEAGSAASAPVARLPHPVSIRPVAIGTVPLASMLEELERRGCARGSEGLPVVLTDDYLHPALAGLNRQAMADRVPWLIVKPVGERIWVGPMLGGEGGPCWECLRHRLARHRPVFEFLRRRAASRGAPCVPMRVTPRGVRTAVDEMVRWLTDCTAPEGSAALAHHVVVIDTRVGGTRRHCAPVRPHCQACHARRSVAWGGSVHDRHPVDEHAEQGLVDPVTGIVAAVRPLGPDTENAVHVWVAQPSPFATADTLPELQAQRRHVSLGRGATAMEARASALGEAVERYSAVFQGTEPRVRASRAELGEQALHPNACMLFSDAQLASRQSADDRSIPPRFDERADIEWSEAQSWPAGAPRFLPTGLLYFAYPATPIDDFCRADSTGCASAPTRDDAILAGLLETIERDAAAIWWYNRLQQPAVPLEAVDDAVVQRLVTQYEREGRCFWVLDITSDLGIPCFAAVTRRLEGPAEVLFGFGCHPAPGVALRRAVTEMHQVVVALAAVRDRSTLAPGLHAWLTDPPADLGHLEPNGAIRWTASTDAAQLDRGAALELSARAVRSQDLDIVVADLTRPELGIPTVKVVVPGLRPIRARFAPGRLYDVPVGMGRRARPCAETELNSTPFFL